MKNIITLLITLLISISSFAQQGINYKALIKDDNGNVISDQEIDIRLTLNYEDVEGNGTITIYEELHTVTTTQSGIVILNIGEGTLIYGEFPQNYWYSGNYMTIEVDLEQDGTFVNLGPTDFKMVPMAIQAKRADLATTALNVSGLEKITENNGTLDKTGWRLKDINSIYYANIGKNALDFSIPLYNQTHGASGDYSVAIGAMARAAGDNSIAIGASANALGDYSVALGYAVTAKSPLETVIGLFNTNYTPDNTSNDRLFTVANGDLINDSDALTILKNGKVGIGRSNPSSLLEVAHQNGAPTSTNRTNAFSIRNLGTGRSWQLYTHSTGYLELFNDGIHKGSFNPNTGVYNTVSDKRMKKDITTLENGTLHKVMQLNPVSYLMKDQTDTKRNLGLISQEVQEIFPSITNYVKEQDLLTLSYTELIPILIKALQEQQGIIEAQISKDVIQDKSIEELVARLSIIESKSTH